MQPLQLAARQCDGIEHEAGNEAEERQHHQAGDQDCGRQTRHQAGFEEVVISGQRPRATPATPRPRRTAAAALPSPAARSCAGSGSRRGTYAACFASRRTVAIRRLHLRDRQAQLQRVHRQLGFGFEAARQRRERLDETPREHAKARQHVADAAAEDRSDRAGQQLVAERVAGPIGDSVVATRAPLTMSSELVSSMSTIAVALGASYVPSPSTST